MSIQNFYHWLKINRENPHLRSFKKFISRHSNDDNSSLYLLVQIVVKMFHLTNGFGIKQNLLIKQKKRKSTTLSIMPFIAKTNPRHLKRVKGQRQVKLFKLTLSCHKRRIC